MLIYGDAVRHEDAAAVLARVRRCLRELALLPPGLARHARLVGALIEAGEFAQGLADAQHVSADAAMSLVRALAECCALSWDSDFETDGCVPAAALAACTDRLPQEPIELTNPAGVRGSWHRGCGSGKDSRARCREYGGNLVGDID